ncbi:MAG: cupin domain-containing protein [Shewanella sp.]|nr:cupin domain-containing protein [Shewanella sp.]MCF1429701.1 cupin domain-containing protein [Shewanella sp.]MCF1437287.1 cupin domain-containing protein [Shewanella sp.]MCF1457855.1 cupin domain-containing protein [Shewanella sp.]
MNICIQDIQLINHRQSTGGRCHLPVGKLIKGNPEQIVNNQYSSPCGQFHSGTWQSGPGKWNVNYTEHEFCDILEGLSIIQDKTGNSLTVAAGDKFVIPAGFQGTWEVVDQCKKIYVIFEQNP